ncbi:hypothetical protein EZV62_007834 [Acer yangbiense]|uniref:Uncharacterized protein n=1 Tax=Acer yangbiense TaxID=1000413 RepID=A0A5C7ICH4_9ROSI|nr:hypothetical protein EZV62_007834 [Acer yangbiense]
MLGFLMLMTLFSLPFLMTRNMLLGIGEKVNASSLEAWMKSSKAPGLEHTLSLFNEIKNKDVKIFLVSSRRETLSRMIINNFYV